VVYDEVHMLPAPVFKITAELQSVYRAGLTATLIREDGREEDVFSLVGPKRFDIPWTDLSQAGWIADAYCIEIRTALPADQELPYAVAQKRDKYKIASMNTEKMAVVEALLSKHKGESIIIIGQYLDQLMTVHRHFGFPVITGSTSNNRRDELYEKFREGSVKVLIVSKVANFAIDLPDASVAIQISGTFGSRQEEAQRLGRILRPKRKSSFFYSIITRNTVEEEFSANRQRFLVEQGYRYETREA
jgi:DNA excision repair protein ERCC-3